MLPEVEDLPAGEPIDLAITRHEHQTDTPVPARARGFARACIACHPRLRLPGCPGGPQSIHYKSMPEVSGQRVSARVDGKMLEIVVADSGGAPRRSPASPSEPESSLDCGAWRAASRRCAATLRDRQIAPWRNRRIRKRPLLLCCEPLRSFLLLAFPRVSESLECSSSASARGAQHAYPRMRRD